MTIQRMEHIGIVVDELAEASDLFVELGFLPKPSSPWKVAGSTGPWVRWVLR